MSKLASLLGGMTLNDLAKEVLSLQGRRGDTELAHVNKREAALLKAHGGAGDVNPSTGMTEYYDGMDYNYDVEAQPGGFYGDAPAFEQEVGQFDPGGFYGGQPTPQVVEAPSVSPPQGNFDLRTPVQETEQPGTIPAFDISTGQGIGFRDFTPALGMPQGAIDAATYRSAGMTPEQVIQAGSTPGAGGGAAQPGIMEELERLAKAYPTASRAALAAALGIPGMVRGQQARQDAARTRREMEQMAAPIRQVGEAQLAAGQRGELTPAQQQQIQAARAAARQDLSRRGVTSGTAAQMAENRITEMADRFAQQNIENGVRLIGAANSYNAAAIQQAYKMNSDANAMTQAYFTNLMRAFGALPTETTTTTTRTP